MPEVHTVQTCRFAEPTLFAVAPYWMAAEEFPWSCHIDGPPRPVEDTARCRTCPRWAESASASPIRVVTRSPDRA